MNLKKLISAAEEIDQMAQRQKDKTKELQDIAGKTKWKDTETNYKNIKRFIFSHLLHIDSIFLLLFLLICLQ